MNSADADTNLYDLARRHQRLEIRFLDGVDSNLRGVLGHRDVPGNRFVLREQTQAADLRIRMAKAGRADPSLFDAMPLARRYIYNGSRPRFMVLDGVLAERTTAVVAAVYQDFDALIAGRNPDPMSYGELVEFARTVMQPGFANQVVAICSPSGFTTEAKNRQVEIPGCQVVLVEPQGPDAVNGWTVHSPGGNLAEVVKQAFNPETPQGKLERIQQALAARPADLATAGVSAQRIARELAIEPATVAQAFREMARTRPGLRLVRNADDTVLLRGSDLTPQQERGMFEWLTDLFSPKRSTQRKVQQLEERRVILCQQRDQMYDDVAALEKKETELKSQGIAAENPVVQRRIAGQLAQVRKDIARQNAAVSLLAAQIDQISTHLHNLSLIRQGEAAGLPSREEMQQEAAKAEELVTQLTVQREEAAALDVGLDAALSSPEEAEILAEFQQARDAKAETTPAQKAPSQPAAPATPARSEPIPPAETDRERTRQRA